MTYKNISDEILFRGNQYVMCRHGRGRTHLKAFKAGAQLILDLLKSGELQNKTI